MPISSFLFSKIKSNKLIMRGLTLTGRTKLQIECLMLAVHIDGYGTKLIKFCTKDSVVE